jgi:hypothetical protein
MSAPRQRSIFDLVAWRSDPGFQAFWQAYPRKDAPKDAWAAWMTAIQIATPAEIIAGLKRYDFDTRAKFRPMPATWLNGQRWMAETVSTDADILRAAGLSDLTDEPAPEGVRLI